MIFVTSADGPSEKPTFNGKDNQKNFSICPNDPSSQPLTRLSRACGYKSNYLPQKHPSEGRQKLDAQSEWKKILEDCFGWKTKRTTSNIHGRGSTHIVKGLKDEHVILSSQVGDTILVFLSKDQGKLLKSLLKTLRQTHTTVM